MEDGSIISFDFAIKYILRHKGNYDILEGFISALLAAEGYSPVKIKALLESESNRESAALKKSLADLVVEDTTGQLYIVEIDRQYAPSFLQKACFSASRLVVDHLATGTDYANIKKVFHISLLYFSVEGMKDALYHGKNVFRSTETGQELELHIREVGKRKKFEVRNIFPEYFLISIPLFNNVVRKEIDEWLYTMKHEAIRDDFKSAAVRKMAKRLAILKMSPKEQAAYYDYKSQVLKQRDVLEGAKLEGVKEGIEIGVEKGKAEAKLELAQGLLKVGVPIETIAQASDLSLAELQKLQKSS